MTFEHQIIDLHECKELAFVFISNFFEYFWAEREINRQAIVGVIRARHRLCSCSHQAAGGWCATQSDSPSSEFHTMRKISLLVAAAVGSMMGAAHAESILIDSFNGPSASTGQQYVFSNSTSATAASSTLTSSQAFDPSTLLDGSKATTRDLSVLCTTSPSIGTGQQPCISASAGGASLTGGSLEINTRNSLNGSAEISWTLPSGLGIGNPASYFFQILSNTTGTPGSVPTTVDFTFNGGSDGNTLNDFSLSNQNFGSVAGVPAVFALSIGQVALLNGGGTLTMALSSTGTGWSISLDQFSLEVPEPGSLALVGLALVGAGVAARRRKAV